MSDLWLIAVTAGKWQSNGIMVAKQLGYKVLGIDGDANAKGLLLCDKSLVLDIKAHDVVIKEIKELNIEIGGVLSICSEAGMPLAAKIREYFQLSGPNIDLTDKLISKKRQREEWKKNNVAGPCFKIAETIDDAKEIAINFQPPYVIKPIDCAGSRGVSKVSDLSDRLDDKIKEAFKYSKEGNIIIESYMDGTEFTVETFCNDAGVHVLCVTEKKKLSCVDGVVAYELATVNRDQSTVSKISKLVVSAFSALGYNCGPGHAEVILMKDGSVGMVEAAGRGGGFNVFDKFIPTVSGYDIVKNTIKQAMGEKTDKVNLRTQHGVLRFIPSTKGKIKDFKGADAVKKLKNVVVESFVNIGDKVEDANCDGDRLGYILSWDHDYEKAIKTADEAEKKIKYVIER